MLSILYGVTIVDMVTLIYVNFGLQGIQSLVHDYVLSLVCKFLLVDSLFIQLYCKDLYIFRYLVKHLVLIEILR